MKKKRMAREQFLSEALQDEYGVIAEKYVQAIRYRKILLQAPEKRSKNLKNRLFSG